MPPAYDLGLPARRVAQVIWGWMLVLPVLFLGVVVALGRPSHDIQPGPPALLLGIASVGSAAALVLSRLVPGRIPARHGAGASEVTALTRCILGWSLCEAVAIFSAAAYLLTLDAPLLGILSIDLLAIVTLYPSRGRWSEYRVARAEQPRDRTVR